MMARLFRAAIFIACFLSAGSAFAAGGPCPSGANYVNPTTGAQVTLASLGVTNCYYISASGSDTNSGTTESSPWLHSPGMKNCASSCAAVSITGGEGFIFRGGDTWHMGNSGLSPYTGAVPCDNNATLSAGLCLAAQNGSNGSPFYYGVDLNWYSGSSWARPIFTGDNPLTPNPGVFQDFIARCAYQIGNANVMVSFQGATYGWIDDFELTGLCSQSNNGSNDYYFLEAGGGTLTSNLSFTRNYIHGWTHLQFTGGFLDNIIIWGGTNTGGFGDSHVMNVVDGSDSDPGGIQFVTYSGAYNYAYNVFRYAANFVPDPVHVVHDNLFEFWYGESDEQHHPNLFEENCCGSGTNNAIYNNVFRNICVNGATNTCPVGSVGTWLEPSVGFTTYYFNNVEYTTGPSINGNYFNIGQNANSGDQGRINSFNNTWDNTTNADIMDCTNNGFVRPFTVANNHYVTDNSSAYSSGCSSGQGTFVTELLQSHATANGQGYNASQRFAFSPTSSSGSTVGGGTSETSTYCSVLSGSSDPLLQAAGTACKSDTTYACTYILTNHTVSCPGRTPVARPTSTAWDRGAYQYSSTQGSRPNPPTNLAATVQ
jgi:hypothetical protein